MARHAMLIPCFLAVACQAFSASEPRRLNIAFVGGGTKPTVTKPAVGGVTKPTVTKPAAGGVTMPTVTKPAVGGVTKPTVTKPAAGGVTMPTVTKPAVGGRPTVTKPFVGGVTKPTGTKPTVTRPPKVFVACERHKIDKAFKDCMASAKDAKARTACRTIFTKAMQDQCKQKVQAADATRLVKDEARTNLAKCQMKATTDTDKKACIKAFEDLTGEKMPTTGDAVKDAAKQKFDAVRGANAAVADGMKKCAAGQTQTCVDNLRKEMEKVSGKALSKEDMAVVLQDAGKKEAATKIKECVSAATSLTTRKACTASADAKAAYAKAMGKDASKITDEEVRKAAKDQSRKDVRDTWGACIDAAEKQGDAAAKATAKKACSQGSELKNAIANSQGLDGDSVQDSMVREYIQKQGQKEKLDFIKTCDRSTAEKAKKCQDLLKDMKAKDAGKSAADISDDEVRKDIKAAMAGDIAQRMKVCTEDAAKDATKLKACRKSMADAMKEASFDGKAPDEASLQRVLKEGAANAAKDVMQNCEKTRKECMELVRQSAASALGEGDKTAVSTRAAEMMMKAGANNAAKDSIKACAKARAENATASCDDAYEKFLATRKMSKPTSVDAQKREKAEVMMGVQKQAVKDSLKVCAEKPTAAEVTTCMTKLKSEAEEVAKTAFGGKSAKVLAAKKKVAESEAKMEFIGADFDACTEAAGSNNTAKDECKKRLTAMRKKFGITEDDSALKKKYNAKKISEGVLACAAAERAACLADAKADFKKTGNKEREFDMQKKMGQVKAAADAWAACSNEGLDETVCNGQAKDVYMKVSGTDGSDWASKVLPKVSKLGKGLKDGTDVVIKKKKQIAVDTATDATTCSDAVGTKLATAVKGVATTPAIAKTKAKGCVKADGKVSYTTAADTSNMDEAQTEAAADKIALDVKKADLTARRLLGEQGRRLTTVTGVGAAVDTEMCASGDSACGQDDFATTTTAAPGGGKKGTASGANYPATLAGSLIVALAALVW